jgi:hypothetical protein
MTHKLRWRSVQLLCVLALTALMTWPLSVSASCGSVSCFVVIGSQQQVSPAGVITMNLFYNNTPSAPASGGANTIPYANQQTKQLILGNTQVNQLDTRVQTATLDLNYGLTDRWGLEVMVPYKWVNSTGQFGPGTTSNFSDAGIGDVMGKVKYNVLPTLRSMLVLEMGVFFPTGDYDQKGVGGQLAESTLQVGRGAWGFAPSFYQTYELMPHRLNQFLQGSWRYNLRNSDGYQFGQEYALNGGFNLVTLPWLTITQQLNYRYKTKDNMQAALYYFAGPPINRPLPIDLQVTDREVPTTNFSFLGYSAGVLVNVFDYAQMYFIAQIPVYRDFNGNLEMQTSYVFGMTKYFTTKPLF